MTVADGRPTVVRSVAIPRAAGDSRLADGLAATGLNVVSAPLVAIGSTAAQMAAVRAAVARHVDGTLVLTSANGVDVLERAGGPAAGVELAVVGTSTARAAAAAGFRADLVPEVQTAAALADLLSSRRAPGPVLYLAAAAAGDDLERSLVSDGFVVERVDAYATVPHTPPSSVVHAAARCDLVAFTAGSTVRRWVDVVGTSVPGVSIGPSTSVVAGDVGQPIAAEATQHDFAGLIDAVAAFARSGTASRIDDDD